MRNAADPRGRKFTKMVHRGYRMGRRQGHELVAARIEERISAHRERRDALLCNSFEDRLDLAIIAGAQDKNLHTDDARRLLHVFQLALKACLQAGRVCLSSAHRTRRFQPCSSTPAASRPPV